jgi:DNA methylase
MVTDPPYGVEYDPAWRNQRGLRNSARSAKIRSDERADWSAAWRLFPGNIAYVWHAALRSTTVAQSLTNEGFAIRAQIIWAKDRLVIGRGDYQWQHEPCWYAVRSKGNWTGDRKQTALWSIPTGGQDAETDHATQKPVECMRRPMLNNSNPGQAVYEPFLGSGTTLIAAETTGRVCSRSNSSRATSTSQCGVGRHSRANTRLSNPRAVILTRSQPNGADRRREKRPRHRHPSGERWSALQVRQEAEMRGRRPKPTRLKVLTGNPGKRP